MDYPAFPGSHLLCGAIQRKPGCLAQQGPAPVEICNDKDGEIVNLFRVLRSEDAGRLLEAVMLTPYSRDELNDSAPAGDAVERARRLLVRSWMGIASDSFRGWTFRLTRKPEQGAFSGYRLGPAAGNSAAGHPAVKARPRGKPGRP